MNTDIEHESLRQEIISSGTHSIDTANIAVTIAGAAILAAFQFRNPYIALLPLFPLYYSHNIVFNNSQTIARTSVYLRLIEGDRYEKLLHKLRIILKDDEDKMKTKRRRLLRWLRPHSVLWEQWISPILQTMFLILGLICILCFGLIAWLVVSKPNIAANASPDLVLGPVYNAVIFAVVFFVWLVLAIRSRRIAHPFYGKRNMVEQFEEAWSKILAADSQKKLQADDKPQ